MTVQKIERVYHPVCMENILFYLPRPKQVGSKLYVGAL